MTTDLVLYEVANSLARNAKPQAQKIISEFLEADGIEIVYASPALFRKGFALYCKYAVGLIQSSKLRGSIINFMASSI